MMIKRGFAAILCALMLLSMMPAVQTQAMQAPTVKQNNLSLEGTDSFSTLLGAELREGLEEDCAAGGYNVVGLTVENGAATAQVRSLEPAILIVGIYTEDGLQLLCSGKTEVQPEDTEVSVTLEGTLPQYFLASAYLVDIYDYAPLCSAYETVMYTEQMQALLASTVEDYDPARVLNMDDDPTTNFAVYEASTIVIEPRAGFNTVVAADDGAATYVIENADGQITDLQTGDIFVLPYGDSNILIVKVAAISINGTTATVTGDRVELEEVFAYAKLEAVGNASDAVVDEATAEEGVVFEGISQAPATRALEGDGKGEYQFNYQLVNKELKDDSEHLSGKVVLNGSLSLRMELSYCYYISMSTQFTQLKFELGVGTSFSVEGKGTGKIGLPDMSIGVLGLRVEFEPELQLEFSAKMEYKAFYSFVIGIYHSSETGTKDLSTVAKPDTDFKAEGTVFFGINLSPVARVLEGLVVTELDVPVGFELKVTPEFGPSQGSTVHSCKECTAMELYFKAEIAAKIKLLDSEKLMQEFKVTPLHVKICDFYSSKDYDSSGVGSCPYKSYRVTVVTEGAGVEVYADSQLLGTTDEAGQTFGYLPAGTYTFTAQQYTRKMQIDSPLRIVLNGNTSDIFSMLDPNSVMDVGVLASGTFGLNQSWVLYHNGVMVVSGTGSMPQWTYSSSTPWYKHKGSIKTVILEEGLTDVGPNAFSGCSKLTEIVFPDSLTTLQNSAFSGCKGLTHVTLGTGLTGVGDNAFWGCTKLSGVVFPQGLKAIGNYAFQECTALQSVTVPASVTTIGSYAFGQCTGLKALTILAQENSQLRINQRAFERCTGLTTLVFPHSIKNLGSYAFYGCTAVTEIYFEGNVMAIGSTTFTKVTANAYYPADNTSWQEYYRQNYGGKLTWAAYTPAATKKPATRAVFGGEYASNGTVKTACFSNLVAGQEYLLLAMVDLEAEDRLCASNLLAVAQKKAGEDGTLTYTYTQRTDTPVSYVIACGPSNKNLQAAEISFPYMEKSQQQQQVLPVVTYEGAVLTEGVDYVLVGSVTYAAPGTFTCGIRGINHYTGFVECSYTVEGAQLFDIDVSRMLLGNSLEFQFGIAMNKLADTTGCYAVIEKGSVIKTVPADQWGSAGRYWAIAYDGLNATEMADTISVTVYNADGEAISNPKTDSVRDYAARAFDSQTAVGKTMLVDMLNYGAAAQEHFGYGTDDLANSKLTDAQKAYGTATAVTTKNEQVKGTNYMGSRLSLESRIQMQVAFKGMNRTMYAVYTYTDYDGETQSVTVNGEDFIEVDGLYGIELSNLVYADARQLVTIKIYNSKGVLLSTVKDSIESYVNRYGETAPLFNALMKFTDSAKAYLTA